MSNDDSEEEMFPIDVGPFRPVIPFVYTDPSLLSGVLRAVAESDLNKLKSLVASGKSLNINDNNGNTALHFAVARNDLDILEYILDQDDILIDIKNEFGETPVSVACLHGLYEAAKMLIDCGADLNCQESDGSTPLHNSVLYPKLTNMLLSKGANVNLPDFVNNTPLHLAVEKQCLETIYILLYYGADVNWLNNFNYNPFMKSLLNNNAQIQEILLDYVDDFNVTSNWSTLYIALRYQSPFYEEIVRRGAVVDIQALKACIHIPNIKNFKFVWNNLDYLNVDLNERGCLLQLFTLWNRKIVSPYVDIILESSNSSVLESLGLDSFSYDFHYVINEYSNTLTYNQITKLTFLLLQHGMKLTTSVIVTVFKCYGRCELFKHLLYIDYVGRWPNIAITPMLIFDIDLDLPKLYREIECGCPWHWDINDLGMFMSYWTYMPIIQLAKVAFRENIANSLLSEDSVIPKIPSLLQLARDETRKYIIDKFKMKCARQYYTYVDYMDVAVVCKHILKYERKLYNIPPDIFQYRRN